MFAQMSGASLDVDLGSLREYEVYPQLDLALAQVSLYGVAHWKIGAPKNVCFCGRKFVM